MITIGSGLAAWLLGKFGTAAALMLLGKLGVPGFVARAVSPLLVSIAQKLIAGQPVHPAERELWESHIQKTQSSVQVAAHPASQFHDA